MAYAFGGRIDDDSYAVTYVDEDQGTAVTIGEINGVPFEGGGSSDFSTAEVTITVGNVEHSLTFDPFAYADSYDEMLYTKINVNVETESTYDAVLYKGHSYVQLWDYDTESYYDITKVSITGDIETIGDAEDWTLDITGNGTITIS